MQDGVVDGGAEMQRGRAVMRASILLVALVAACVGCQREHVGSLAVIGGSGIVVGGGGTGGGAGGISSCTALSMASTVAIDGSSTKCESITITGNVTFSTTGLAAGSTVTLVVTADSTKRLVYWPSGWSWSGTPIAFIPPSKTATLTIRSFTTADSGVQVAFDLQGAASGSVVQRIATRQRNTLDPCTNATLLPGMRRKITTTWGTYLDLKWDLSASLNEASNDANYGLVTRIDGVEANRARFRTQTISSIATPAFHTSGNARVHVEPGDHVVELYCSDASAALAGFAASIGTIDNLIDGGAGFTIEEIREPEWSYTQIPQVVGTDMILVADWRADSGVTVDANNRVTSWADISGSAYSLGALTQATSGLRPLLVANCQNGMPCVRFDPTRMDALTLVFTNAASQRVILAGNHTHQTSDPYFIKCDRVDNTNCTQLYLGSSSAAPTHEDRPIIYSGGTRVETAAKYTGKHIFDFRWDTTVTGIRTDLGINATQDEETGVGIVSRGNMQRICGDDGNGVGCALDVYEIQIWQGDPTNLATDGFQMNETDDIFVREPINRRWAIYTDNTGI